MFIIYDFFLAVQQPLHKELGVLLYGTAFPLHNPGLANLDQQKGHIIR